MWIFLDWWQIVSVPTQQLSVWGDAPSRPLTWNTDLEGDQRMSQVITLINISPSSGDELGPVYRGGAGLVPDLPQALHWPHVQAPQEAGQPRQERPGEQDRDSQDGVKNEGLLKRTKFVNKTFILFLLQLLIWCIGANCACAFTLGRCALGLGSLY